MFAQSDIQEWLNAYGDAWAKGDPDEIITLFSDDAIYQETPFDKPMQGSEAIRNYWQQGAADAQKNVTFSSDLWFISNWEAYAGWQASFQRVPSEVNVELNGTFHLTFTAVDQELKCKKLLEWWHRRETPAIT